MSGSIVAVVFALAIGWPLATLSGAEPSRSGRLGLALLLGLGAVPLVLLLLGFARVPWSLPAVFGALAVTALAAAAVARRAEEVREGIPGPSGGSLVLLAAAAVVVAGHATFALTGPPTQSDFLEIWGLKGRVFYEQRGIDWEFLRHETTVHNHPGYPPLVPLLFAAAAVLGGGWVETETGVLYTAFGAALLLVAEAALRRRFGSTWLVGAAVLVLTPLALSPWLGNADGPLVAFAGAAMLCLARGVLSERRAAVTGAILLGLAALTKNEGIAMIASAALALAVATRGWTAIRRLWPAAALAALWLIPRRIAGLELDLAAGSPLKRLTARIADPLPWLSLLGEYSGLNLAFWAGLALGAVVVARTLFRTERVLVAFAAVQVLFYLGAYAVSPHDLGWHVRWSWERLVSHVAFVLTIAVLSGLLARLQGAAAERQA